MAVPGYYGQLGLEVSSSVLKLLCCIWRGCTIGSTVGSFTDMVFGLL
jgi:hypothetical protein